MTKPQIKEDDFVMLTADRRDWFGYVDRFVEPNHKGIRVRWHPQFTSWHDYDELTLVDFPAKVKP